ncbi:MULTISPECIES: DUF397 domain-containing protein [Actinopolyspora]|uniref:DUF397 domain-containing protein n=1 Tax=Actinopolyspora saharensis TaxID=995062 RepID=A0A1H1EAC5_9ACTN|nr:DUF397 domain-containing protein [Actinopolyspora saharensis]NHD18993.1 DUF397 domain-containing protein [Actinopolyspora sp. BKK2]NHE78222.1 DUF397 domain-containing protein [Actinopolyspora sp. BKK1]SDQ85409.1 protein of unknown function [Actinopolyspora saharensis]
MTTRHDTSRWRKSSYSDNGANCVEVAALPGAVAARDSKDRAGAVLTFDRQQWRTFLRSLRD